jgi:hypothetical protein
MLEVGLGFTFGGGAQWGLLHVDLDAGYTGVPSSLKFIGICHWWLTPVILATQEAEIRTISVRSQTR